MFNLTLEKRVQLLQNIKIYTLAAAALFISIPAFEYLAAGLTGNLWLIPFALICGVLCLMAYAKERRYRKLI